MKPKTNREKADKVLSIRPWHNLGEAQKFILFTAVHTESQLTTEAWEELNELYHHVGVQEEGDECPKKGPEVQNTETKHPRFIERIDWDLLRDQKKMLVTMDTYHELSQAEEDAITGITHLIDAIQDYAVDSMGLRNREVFNLPG